jgi:hypothetical protein
LAEAGEPVMGGAPGRICAWAGGTWGSRDMLGIGLVTAVDHAGGTLCGGTGAIAEGGRIEAGFIGNVVAAERFGRGVIHVEAGLSGRGGRLMRSVSRLGGFDSGFSGSRGLPSSAIVELFIGILGKCSMVKFVIVTLFAI